MAGNVSWTPRKPTLRNAASLLNMGHLKPYLKGCFPSRVFGPARCREDPVCVPNSYTPLALGVPSHVFVMTPSLTLPKAVQGVLLSLIPYLAPSRFIYTLYHVPCTMSWRLDRLPSPVVRFTPHLEDGLRDAAAFRCVAAVDGAGGGGGPRPLGGGRPAGAVRA